AAEGVPHQANAYSRKETSKNDEYRSHEPTVIQLPRDDRPYKSHQQEHQTIEHQRGSLDRFCSTVSLPEKLVYRTALANIIRANKPLVPQPSICIEVVLSLALIGNASARSP